MSTRAPSAARPVTTRSATSPKRSLSRRPEPVSGVGCWALEASTQRSIAALPPSAGSVHQNATRPSQHGDSSAQPVRETGGVRIDVTSAETLARVDLSSREVVFDVDHLTVAYHSAVALSGVSMKINRNLVTAVIGPSGCGKSTFIRCLNRMNDLIPGVAVTGRLLYH